MNCNINGNPYTRHIEPDLLLIDFLRNLGFLSIKQGCDTTNCGLCTVWVDEKPKLSCAILTASIQGRQVTTIEGLQKEAAAFGQFLADEGADQCGFCSPGFIMTVLAMEKELKNDMPEKKIPDSNHQGSGDNPQKVYSEKLNRMVEVAQPVHEDTLIAEGGSYP